MKLCKGFKGARSAMLPGFIHESQRAAKQTQISVRIPLELRARFDQAQATLREHGYDMQLADLVRIAIQDACDLVSERYSQIEASTGASRASKEGGNNSFGEHSSHGPVEEWGAKKNGGVSSTKSEAPTPQGSRTTRSVERGGGFEGDEEVSRG